MSDQPQDKQVVEKAKALFYNEAAKDRIGFRYRPTYDAALEIAINAAITELESALFAEREKIDALVEGFERIVMAKNVEYARNIANAALNRHDEETPVNR
jgi:hypothetical protein